MTTRKRLKDHKHQSMRRRLTGGKTPMSAEQKEVEKKKREADKALNEKTNQKKQAKK
jgi:hypothetical protein